MSEQAKFWIVECKYHKLSKMFNAKYKAEQELSRDQVRPHPNGITPVMRQ